MFARAEEMSSRKRQIYQESFHNTSSTSSSSESVVDASAINWYDEDDDAAMPLDLTAKKRPKQEEKSSSTSTSAVDLSNKSSSPKTENNLPLDLRKPATPPGHHNAFSAFQPVISSSRLTTSPSASDNTTSSSTKHQHHRINSVLDDDETKTSDDSNNFSIINKSSGFQADDFSDDGYDNDDGDHLQSLMKMSSAALGLSEILASKISSTPPTFFRCNGTSSECPTRRTSAVDRCEHMHCKLCGSASPSLMKKEDVETHERLHLTHQTWLSRGFLRCIPLDKATCNRLFPKGCSFAGHQTHYHCLQPGCNRSYANTEEAQQHAALHRRESVIALDGFQRFRATDVCGNRTCPYLTAHTTHFHCRRENCGYAFKVKADMEKHKIYHQRDDDYLRDGFRKFMKYQDCPFPKCNLSKVTNHIHCLRCGYVLHSSGQLTSHRRKHDREDHDLQQRNASDMGTPPSTVSSITMMSIKQPMPKTRNNYNLAVPTLSNSSRSAFQPVVINTSNRPVAKTLDLSKKLLPTAPKRISNNSSSNIIAHPVLTKSIDQLDDDETADIKQEDRIIDIMSIDIDGEVKMEPAAQPVQNSVENRNLEIKAVISSAGEQCSVHTHCIYAGRGIEHFHCPLPSTDSGASTLCSCTFTRLAILNLHLKAVHNYDVCSDKK